MVLDGFRVFWDGFGLRSQIDCCQSLSKICFKRCAVALLVLRLFWHGFVVC